MAKILVTAKVNPDLDGTSCTLAYSDFLTQTGKVATGIIFGQPQSEVGYFTQNQKIQIPTHVDDGNFNCDGIVLVDASSMKGMPKVVKADQVVEIIDHRKSEPEKEFPNAKIQNELIGAAATIVVERFINQNLKPQPDHAKLLYGAIFHNTLNFIATNTTDRDRMAAKFLEENFNLSQNMIKEMFNFATKIIENDIKKAISDDAKEFGDGYTIKAYQLVVWGDNLLKRKSEINKALFQLDSALKAELSFINIIDVKNKHSIIFASNKKTENLLSQALNCEFDNQWSLLPTAWLRKQIMPRVLEIVN